MSCGCLWFSFSCANHLVVSRMFVNTGLKSDFDTWLDRIHWHDRVMLGTEQVHLANCAYFEVTSQSFTTSTNVWPVRVKERKRFLELPCHNTYIFITHAHPYTTHTHTHSHPPHTHARTRHKRQEDDLLLKEISFMIRPSAIRGCFRSFLRKQSGKHGNRNPGKVQPTV